MSLRLIKRILWGLVAAVVLVYAGDYVFLRVRMPKSVTTVEVQPYYAVKQRNGKYEIMMLDPQDAPCVESLFPHMGDSPCWYLRGHTQKRIDM